MRDHLTTMVVKVVIVDDHPVFLAGIRTILESAKEVLLIGEAKDGQEAIKLVAEKLPDLVIMDISMPHMDGIQATKHIRSTFPDTKVLALSIHSGKRFIKEMLDAGASGYLLKDSAPDELVTAILKIAEGDMYLSSNITQSALSKDEAEDESKIHSILYTKLHRPPVLEDIIIRTEIVEQLEKNLDNPLSLICAPAGYGKSILVSQWLEQTRARYTWVSLDEELNELRIFLFYIRAAIEKLFPLALEKTGVLLQAVELPTIRVLAHTLLNELDQIKEDFILVLDDYHMIHEESIHRLIDEILRFPPEHMHLTILTRRDPSLRISMLRAHGRMTEIRMEDLSFSVKEIIDLFQNLHNEILPEATARTIRDKTEGWIVGLRLASQAIRKIEEIDHIVTQLKGSFHSISAFLMQEVLSQQPAGIQDMMRMTSIFNRFCRHIIDDVCLKEIDRKGTDFTGDGFIQWLIKSNLFVIPLDMENHWFRYHHLFQELLIKQFEQHVSADKMVMLHRQASKWYQSKDLIEEAILHALEAGDPIEAARIIESHRLEELELDRWYRLERWLAMIPHEVLQERPLLLLSRAWIYYQQSKIVEVVEIVERLEQLFKIRETDDELIAELSFFHGFFTYFEGEGETSRKYLEEARAKLKGRMGLILGEVDFMLGMAGQMCGQEESSIQILNQRIFEAGESEKMYLTRVLGGLSLVQMLSGYLPQVEEVVQRMHRVAIESRSLYALDWADYIKGWVSFHAHKKDRALEGFKSAVKRRYNLEMTLLVNAYIGLVLTYQDMLLIEDANMAMEQLREIANDSNDEHCLSLAQSCQARLSLLQGDLPSALHWARTYKEQADISDFFVWMDAPLLTKSRVLIAEGSSESLNEAVDLLQQLRRLIRSVHFTCQEMDILILLSIAFEKQARRPEALAILEEVVLLASPRRWIRSFIEAGSPMVGLLKILLDKDVEVAYIEMLLSLLEKGASEQATMTTKTSGMKPVSSRSYVPNVEEIRLTTRETEILNLLAEGLRNKEIASRIYVSEDTVKKHLYNIYQKMEVSNRMELVNISKALGILTT